MLYGHHTNAHIHTNTHMQSYIVTDKAISQNARLLGYLCKTCKNCDSCCWSITCSIYKKLERGKRHNAVCDIATLNKISKQSSICQDQPTAINRQQ
jgi:hypothetical protein